MATMSNAYKTHPRSHGWAGLLHESGRTVAGPRTGECASLCCRSACERVCENYSRSEHSAYDAVMHCAALVEGKHRGQEEKKRF
jgi:hypothetical protein